jgi:TolB-like protein/DNA-binding winged helix-turn-helix (wHTH) protein/tetratricopeptide (TPR) repeat protein
MEPVIRQVVRFGVFELDTRSGELRSGGVKIRLPGQSFQILELLVERGGELVSREELRQRLWRTETFVDFDAGLNNAIKKLRDALGDSADTPRFIETLPRRGYRFLAPLETPGVPLPDIVTADSVALSRRRVRARWGWSGAVALAVLVTVLLLLTVSGWRERLFRSLGLGAAPTQIRSLVVLPFENLTGDAEQDYFVDGMTEALTTTLAQIQALRVISRTSAIQYKRTKKPLWEIARELNVDAVVEGAVVRSGDRVRVDATLIDVRTDRHRWAQSYERAVPDVLALQADVAGAIANAVHVELRPEERRRLTRIRSVHPDAYDEYLKGRFFWSNRSTEAVLKAVEHFSRAIERDPTYAPAYSGLSDTYRMFDVQGLATPRESMPKAEAAARRALALDDTLAEAHASLAGVLYRYHWDWENAGKEFQRSLELDPNYAEGHRAQAVYLVTLRRHDEALVAARRARELSPLSAVITVELATCLWRLGRYDDAIAQLYKTLEINPRFSRAYMQFGIISGRKGDLPQAIVAFERAVALSSRRAYLQWLGYGYGVAGRRGDALRILAELETVSKQRYVSPHSFAIVHLGLGQKEEALGWLEKAFDERAFEVLSFAGPVFELLHDQPRFQDLLRRMGLARTKGYLSSERG